MGLRAARLPSEAANIIGQLEQGYAGLAGDSVAMVFLGLNDHDNAFQWLSQGFEERDGFGAFVPSWVVWHPLRDAPRFQALSKTSVFSEIDEPRRTNVTGAGSYWLLQEPFDLTIEADPAKLLLRRPGV